MRDVLYRAAKAWLAETATFPDVLAPAVTPLWPAARPCSAAPTAASPNLRMERLLARLRAALHRAPPRPEQRVFTTRRSPSTSPQAPPTRGATNRLTPIDWHLIEVLALNTGSVVTGGQLLPELGDLGRRDSETSYQPVYMAQLRMKRRGFDAASL